MIRWLSINLFYSVHYDQRRYEAYEVGYVTSAWKLRSIHMKITENSHVAALTMDSHRDNSLFRALIGSRPQV